MKAATMATWLAVIIRGVSMQHPSHIKVRQHRKWVLLTAQVGSADNGEAESVDIVLENAPRFRFTPETVVHVSDFKGEWPPFSIMKELERPRLVTSNGEPIQ